MALEEEVGEFLTGRSTEDCVAIALQAARRAFPLIIDATMPEHAARTLGYLSASLLLRLPEISRRILSSPKDITLQPFLAQYTNVILEWVPLNSVTIICAAEAVRHAAGVPLIPEIRKGHLDAAEAANDALVALEKIVDGRSVIGATREDIALLNSGHTPAQLLRLPLWGRDTPSDILNVWSVVERRMQGWDGFDFWVRWYRSLLVGPQMSSELIDEIASIDQSVWGAGPDRVADVIAEIELKQVRELSPLAEAIEWVPGTRTVRAVPVGFGDPGMWETVVGKLQDALEDIRPNGELSQHHAALAGVAGKLERTVQRYADNPQRVHDDMQDALAEIDDLIAEEGIADDPGLKAFCRILETNAIDIRSAILAVASVVQRRAAARIRNLPKADCDAVRKVALIVADHSDRALEQDLREDVETVLSDDGESGGGRPAAGRMAWRESAAYRLVSRLVRIVGVLKTYVPEIFKGISVQLVVAKLRELIGF